MEDKSTVDEIRARFDADVERFSNLETGQVSTIDAALSLEIITRAAQAINPNARDLLDVGCGAGNYTLKMLSKIPDLNCTLLDLSGPMLERAKARVSSATKGEVKTVQSDIRTAPLEENSFDIILAGAVLHHLRDDADWEAVFTKLHSLLKKGGCLMVSDLVSQDNPAVESCMKGLYADYLYKVGGAEYRDKVVSYVAKEDSPRSVNYQLDLMKKVGFTQTDILHKNICFAAYCGVK